MGIAFATVFRCVRAWLVARSAILALQVSTLPWVSLWNQSVGESVLPGLPPSGPPDACYLQACPGYSCSNTSPIVPLPHPCSSR